MEEKVKEALEKAQWKSGNELLEQWEVEKRCGDMKNIWKEERN